MTTEITPTTTLLLDALSAGIEVVDLGRLLTVGMPQSPNHPAYWHSLPRRHGDMVRGDGDVFKGLDAGVPGVSEAGASWLAERKIHAAGADTIAFECLKPGAGHSLLPAHRVLLVEAGIYIIETMDLETLAAKAIHEFLFVLSPLPLFGATGSPVRPLAVVGRG